MPTTISPSGDGATKKTGRLRPGCCRCGKGRARGQTRMVRMGASMALLLTINGISTPAAPGPSLFDFAEQAGRQGPHLLPETGQVQGMPGGDRRREWIVSRRPPTQERHLKGNFRLSCQTHVDFRRRRRSAATPCAAGRCASSAAPSACRRRPAKWSSIPAVTRDGDRILIDGQEIDRSTGPIHGIAMDLGTTTVVLRLYQPGNRRSRRRRLVRKSAAFRRLGRDVAHLLRHATTRPSC